MSEPVTNAEIEDVLSSIRRLVSQDPGKVRRHPDGTEAEAETKFVLTPAHRVSDADADAETQGDTSAVADADAGAGFDDAAAGLEADEPDAEAHEAHAWHEVEEAAETAGAGLAEGEAERWDRPGGPVEAVEAETPVDATDDPDRANPAFRHNPLGDAGDGARPGDDGSGLMSSYDMSLEERIAELEAAINQSAGDWEPDGSEDAQLDDATRPIWDDRTDAADAGVLRLTPRDAAATEAEFDGEPSQDAAEAGAPSEVEWSAADTDREDVDTDDPGEVAWDDGPEAMDRRHAGDDAADAEVDDEAREDASFHPAPAGSDDIEAAEEVDGAEEIEAAEETDGAEEAERRSWFEAAAAADTARREGAGDEAAFLDEDALRQIVAECVREELQGVLGERITRNIRRLVRREIQRAMSLRDVGQ